MKNIKHQKDIKASTFLWQKNYFLTNDPPFWPKNPKLTPNSSLHQPPPEKKNLKIGSKFIPPPPTALKSTLNSPSPFKTRRLKRSSVFFGKLLYYLNLPVNFSKFAPQMLCFSQNHVNKTKFKWSPDSSEMFCAKLFVERLRLAGVIQVNFWMGIRFVSFHSIANEHDKPGSFYWPQWYNQSNQSDPIKSVQLSHKVLV